MPKRTRFFQENDSTVGAKIRALRRIRGLSLQQMSQETGMSYSYLSGLRMASIQCPYNQSTSASQSILVSTWCTSLPSGAVPKVFRKEELFRGNNAFADIAYRVITPEKTSNLQVSYVYLPPMNPASGISTSTARGQEMWDYFDGCVCVMVEEERYRIEQGDV